MTRRKHAERFNQVLGRLRQAYERRKRRCKEQRRNRRRLRKGLECYFKRRRLREAQQLQGKDHQQVELFDQVLGRLRQLKKLAAEIVTIVDAGTRRARPSS